jgi:hypothetical protein
MDFLINFGVTVDQRNKMQELIDYNVEFNGAVKVF